MSLNLRRWKNLFRAEGGILPLQSNRRQEIRRQILGFEVDGIRSS
jgi:hypothetical protein